MQSNRQTLFVKPINKAQNTKNQEQKQPISSPKKNCKLNAETVKEACYPTPIKIKIGKDNKPNATVYVWYIAQKTIHHTKLTTTITIGYKLATTLIKYPKQKNINDFRLT